MFRPSLRPIFYILMSIAGVVAGYSLLTATSPHSLLRHIAPDPRDDVYIAFGASFLVFIIGFALFFLKDADQFLEIVRLNQPRIDQLRKEGSADAAIADSILGAMGIAPGRQRRLAKKKLIAYMSQTPDAGPDQTESDP